MDKRKLMLLVGALFVAVVTALAARNLAGGSGSPQAAAAAQLETGTKVLVAQRALPVGTIITADAIGFKAWPKEMVQDAYFLEGEADMSKMLGTVVRNPITAGEPITQGSLVAPGDRGFLAAALGPGMRAVTIPVSARTAVAGFVFPGDHIDLVLTQTVRGMIPSRSRPPKRSCATCACSPPTSRPRRKRSKARPRSRPSAPSPSR
jgi:pilus assembly protein CpaB